MIIIKFYKKFIPTGIKLLIFLLPSQAKEQTHTYTMSNIKKIEEILKNALQQPALEDAEEFEAQLQEIELSLADFYPETPYYTYLMTLITKIKEVHGIDEENIDEDFLLPDEDFVIDFPEEEYTDEDKAFQENEDDCLNYLFE